MWRCALGAVGGIQLALGALTLLGADDHGDVGTMGTEMLGAGILAVLTALSAMDLAAGRVGPVRVVSHLVLVLGFVLGLVVTRGERAGGSPGPTTSGRRGRWPRPRTSAPSISLLRIRSLGTAVRRRDAA